MTGIPITKPFLGEDEILEVKKTLESGWLVQGPKVAEFERLFRGFTGAKFARATSSCTTALHLALEALGIGEGDSVLVPSFTYVASANSVLYTGAEVILCDINLETFNVDMQSINKAFEANRGKKIRGIIPVNLFGLCAPLPEIISFAKEKSLKVVEDSACGFGAWIGKRHSGTFGDIGCFSFHPRKSITTGEGGMVVTDNEEIDSLISSLRDHGASRSDLQRHMENGGSLLPEFSVKGYNYRMTDLQGALGVSQMKKVEFIFSERAKIAKKYDSFFKDIPFLTPPFVPDGYRHGYQSYVALFTGGEKISSLSVKKVDQLNFFRNKFMGLLESKGISVRQGTHAVHTLSYYVQRYGFKPGDFPGAYAADRLSIAFPLYVGMTDREFDYIANTVKEALQSVR